MKLTVLLMTGPGGAGKSTIAKLIASKRGFEYVDGDREDTEFFPDGDQWLPENSEKLTLAHKKILKKTKDLVAQGKSVVVDYIIFGQYLEFLKMFQEAFGDSSITKVLFPSEQEMIQRDKQREGWTTGAKRIREVRFEFESIKSEIGADNFIDTSNQTPEETYEKYFSKY